MTEGKNDFITKRVDDVKKIFGLAERDFMALMLVISLIGNVVLVWAIISINSNLNARIVEEVKLQVVPVERKMEQKVDQRVDESLQPIREGVKEAKGKLDTIINKVRP